MILGHPGRRVSRYEIEFGEHNIESRPLGKGIENSNKGFFVSTGFLAGTPERALADKVGNQEGTACKI